MTTNFRDFVEEIEARSSPEEQRELDGLTQQQLATASGVAQADISRIERGQSNPTAETLEALAVPLGVTLDLVPATQVTAEHNGED
jgi:transcriptional regulator with XRE-family HTH domain